MFEDGLSGTAASAAVAAALGGRPSGKTASGLAA